MDNDDRPVGQVLSRREALALFGTASAALLVGYAPNGLVEPTSVAPDPTSSEG